MISTPIRVLCVDDHPLMREGISTVVRNEDDMLVVAEAINGAEAIAHFRKYKPDVTLMDLRLPDISGIDALRQIRSEFRNARIVMLTTFEGDVDIRRALKEGARGYLLKNMPRVQLVEAIRMVHDGKRSLPPEVLAQLTEYMGQELLSQREVEVLQQIAGGNRNCDIASILRISEETVKGHVKHIMEKLNASDRTEAVAIGVRRGIISL